MMTNQTSRNDKREAKKLVIYFDSQLKSILKKSAFQITLGQHHYHVRDAATSYKCTGSSNHSPASDLTVTIVTAQNETQSRQFRRLAVLKIKQLTKFVFISPKSKTKHWKQSEWLSNYLQISLQCESQYNVSLMAIQIHVADKMRTIEKFQKCSTFKTSLFVIINKVAMDLPSAFNESFFFLLF